MTDLEKARLNNAFGKNLVIGEPLQVVNNPMIDYSRPLSEYGTIQQIVNHIKLNPKNTENVPTKSLNKHGQVIQDDMVKYLADDGYSSGVLKAALINPLKMLFLKSKEKQDIEKAKIAAGKDGPLKLGTLLHECLLEPTKFSRIIVEPKYSKSSFASIFIGIKFYEGLCDATQLANAQEFVKGIGAKSLSVGALEIYSQKLEELASAQKFVKQSSKKSLSLEIQKIYLLKLKEFADKDPVSQEHYIKAQILKQHMDNYDKGSGILYRLLKHSKRECSVYYNDPDTGMRYKIRPDSMAFEENIGVNAVISVKSTFQEDIKGFAYQSAKLNYDLSEAMYLDIASKATGRDFNTTIMIILQTVEPYSIGLCIWNPADLETGKVKYIEATDIVKTCVENDNYPSYDARAEPDDMGIFKFTLPDWNQRNTIDNLNLE